MNKKGFTLIELLSVIVILAVLAVILIPTINGIIENSKKSALKDSAYGLVEAANLYYFKNIGISNYIEFVCNNKECISSNSDKLSYKGTIENGNIRIYENGTVAVCIYDEKYHVIKNTSDSEVKLGDGSCRYNEDTNEYISSEVLLLNIYTDGAKVSKIPTIGNYFVTATCTNDKSAAWNYNDWKLDLVESKNEVCNIDFNTKKYTVSNKTYVSGEQVTWAGLNWYVINSNSESITVISKDNYQTGKYGDNTTWKTSTAYNKLNVEFINGNNIVKDAIAENSIVYESTVDSYVRLPYSSELSTSIPNGSNTSFWTMTVNGTSLGFGKKEGTIGTSYTLTNYVTYYSAMMDGTTSCSQLYTLSCNSNYSSSNYILPTLTSVNDVVSSTLSGNYYSSTCSYGYTGGNYYYSCTPSGTRYDFFGAANGYYANQATGGCEKRTCYSATSTVLGYRPVITILKSKI